MEIFILVSVLPYLLLAQFEDYFDDIEEENCKHKSEMDMLSNEKNKCHTVINVQGARAAFQMCKDRLNKYLLYECGRMANVSFGFLLYCNERGQTRCCLADVNCQERSDSNTALMIYNVAKSYLADSSSLLKRLYDAGYGSCYDIGGKDH